MFTKLKWLKLMSLAFSSLLVIGCFSFSYLIDMDTDGSGRGVIYHSITFPDTSETENSNISLFDSYSQRLYDEGWENIEVNSPGNGQIQISATYRFDILAGKNLPESLKNMSIKIEEGEDGTKNFIFDGTYDLSQFKTSWENIKKGQSIDLGPLFGGEQMVITKEEVDQYISLYGEPSVEYKIKLAGEIPIEATGQWNNRDDFLDGVSDTLEFLWNPNLSPTGTLHAVSQWSPEPEETEEPTPITKPTYNPYVDEDLIGKPCDQFCLSLDPIGFWIEGESYPDCKCNCGKGNTFSQLRCVNNDDLCSGEGMRLIQYKDGSGGCMCTDPLKKYDQNSRTCIDLDGSECNYGNGCEPEFGENCQNCSDCGCSFGSGANSQYSQWLTCNPVNSKSDIYGCVFEIPDKNEQLEIMKEEWNQCRDAWAIMNLAGGYGITGYHAEVMGQLSELSVVQTWQQKSGCIPIAGVVLGREAADPMVCLMRYCDRINTGIHELEQQIQKNAPVVRGPAIKVNAPDVHVDIGPLQVPTFYGPGAIYGDGPLSLHVTMGAGFVQSKYEIVSDPNEGLKIFLFEGSYTHTYIDTETTKAKQISLLPGEMLATDMRGMPLSKEAFDPSSRPSWWNDVDYLVNCPENSTQQGPDCFCDQGYVMDAELEICEFSTKSPNSSPESNNSKMRNIMRFLLSLCATFLIGLAIVIFIIFKSRR
ncbi:MAG: hypothetical protein CVU42_12550 [Chloroflexi bacterium HGW-Chloroflexi-4]|nr:MAG: hypothetical protein CVU42_12550 [Chloroflexi bacterium HGW-Chloroflexi-4]